MQNEQSTISFKVTLDNSQLSQGKTEVISAFSGMGTAMKNLGDRGTTELKRINDEALKAAKYFDETAKSIGLTSRELKTALDYWRSVEREIEKSVKANEIATGKRIKDSELLNRKLEMDAERTLRENLRRHEEERKNHHFLFDQKMKTEADYRRTVEGWQREHSKAVNKLRDDELKHFIENIHKQNQALKNQTELEKTLQKSINNRFGNQFKSVAGRLSGDGGFGGFASNIFSGGLGAGSTGGIGGILSSAFRGGAMASADGAGLGGILGGAAGGAAIGAAAAGIGLLVAAFAALIPVLQEGASALLDYMAKLEQVRMGFVTLLGSVDAANKHIRELQEFAASTPFEFAGVADASRKLLAMGVEAKNIIPQITAIGNAVSAIGGDNQSFQRVVKAFADIHARSKLTGEEIRQLANNMIPVIPILSKELGKSSQEIIKMTRDGKISADLFVAAFERFVKNNWGDAMEKQSKTFLGALNNTKDMLYVIGSQAFSELFSSISRTAQHFSRAFKGADGIEGVLDRAIALFSYYGGYYAGKLIDGFVGVLSDPKTYARIAVGLTSIFANVGRGLWDSAVDKANEWGKKTGLDKIPYIGAVLFTNDKRTSVDSETQKQAELARQLKEQNDILRKEEERQQRISNASTTLNSRLNERLESLNSVTRLNEAYFGNRLVFNRQQEGQLDRVQTQNRLNSNNEQLKAQLGHFQQMEVLYADNAEKLKELSAEKNKVINQLETDSVVERLNFAKRELERRYAMWEEWRQATIKSHQIAENEIKHFTSQESRLVEQAMTNGNLTRQQGYDRLIQLTMTSYEVIRARTIDQYALQLRDVRLTAEARTNLERERNLEIAQLAEDNEKNIRSIRLDGYQRMENDLVGHVARTKELYSSLSNVYSSIGSLVNPDSFNPDNLNNALGISDLLAPRKELLGNIEAMTEKSSRFKYSRDVLRDSWHSLPDDAKTDAAYEKMSRMWDALTDKMSMANTRLGELQNELANLQGNLPDKFFDISGIAAKMIGGEMGIEGFDEINKAILSAKRALEDANFAADIELIRDLLNSEQLKGNDSNADRIKELTAQLNKLTREETTKAIRQQAEEIERYNNSLEGLRESGAKLANRDKGTVLGIEFNTKKDVLREHKSLLEENIALEKRIGLQSIDSADQYRNSWLKAILAVKNEAGELARIQAESDVAIARQTTFNAEAARTQIKEHLAGAKGYTEIFADAFTNLSDTIADSFGGIFDRINAKLGTFGRFITDISSNLLRLVANRLIMKLVDWMLGGGNQANRSVGFQVPSFGGWNGQNGATAGSMAMGGFGSIAQAVLGGFRSNSAVGAGMSAASFGRGNFFDSMKFNPFTGQLEEVFNVNGGGSGSSITAGDTLSGQLGNLPRVGGLPDGFGSIFKNGKFSMSGLGEMIAPILPMMGLSLGASLGGRSLTGGILGGASGLLLGGLGGLAALGGSGAAIFASGGALSGLGGVASFLGAAAPFLAPLAVAGLIGAKLLSRNAEWRENEKVRTQLYQEANGQLDSILAQIKSSPSNAISLLQQADQVRSSYIEQAGKISDSKTRRIALAEANERHGQIFVRMERIRSAAQLAANQNKYFNSLIPEFATGGTVLGQLGAAQMVIAHGGEIFVNRRQQTPEVMQALANAGVPNTSQMAGDAGRGFGNRNDSISVELSIGTETQNQLFVNGARSDRGLKVLVQANKSNKENREI